MFEVPNDPEMNEALRDAIKSSSREMYDVVYFDWDQDGTYDHEYTDLSSIVVDARLERATLTSDLPEAINTIQGYSSAELTLVLAGARNTGDLTAMQLFSPFYTRSPFRGTRLTGVEVTYWKEVVTALGVVRIPQFRGVIRSIQFDAVTEQVHITCSDAMNWIANSATLPHWAANRVDRGEKGGSGAAAMPINAQWVIGELLAAGGTPIGPAARPDAAFFTSGNGGFIPRVGTIARSRPPYAVHGITPLLGTDPWEEGKYGLAYKGNYDSDGEYWGTDAQCWLRDAATSRVIDTSAGQRLAFSYWFKSRGTGEVLPFPDTYFGVMLPHLEGIFLDVGLDASSERAHFSVNTTDSGQTFVYLGDGSWGGTPYEWKWTFPPLSEGWHFIDANIRFLEGSVECTFHVDGVQVQPTSSETANTGFIPYDRPDDRFQRNIVNMDLWGSAQHIQLYNSEYGFDPRYMHPPTFSDGTPKTSISRSANSLYWLPDVDHANVWEMLGTVTSAEFGAVYTDELGTLNFRTHEEIRPADGLNEVVETYTVNDILSMMTNPSLDQYRNIITAPCIERWAVKDLIFQPATADDLPILTGLSWQSHRRPVSEVIQAQSGPITPVYRKSHPSYPSWDDDQALDNYAWNNSSIMTITMFALIDPTDSRAWDDAYITVPNKAFRHYLTDDGRYIDLWGNISGGGGVGVWMGARAPEEADVSKMSNPQDLAINMRVHGMVYSEPNVVWRWADADEEIDEFGKFELRLETNDWRQHRIDVQNLLESLLLDTVTPAPIVENLAIPSDPRLQIRDIIELDPQNNFSSPVRAQVLGIRRASAEAVDYIDVRIIETPSTWVLGDPSLSLLGITTILGD